MGWTLIIWFFVLIIIGGVILVYLTHKSYKMASEKKPSIESEEKKSKVEITHSPNIRATFFDNDPYREPRNKIESTSDQIINEAIRRHVEQYHKRVEVPDEERLIKEYGVLIDETQTLIELWKRYGNGTKSEFKKEVKSKRYNFEVIDPTGVNNEDWDIGVIYRNNAEYGYVIPRNNKKLGINISEYFPEFKRAGTKVIEIKKLATAQKNKFTGRWEVKESGKFETS